MRSCLVVVAALLVGACGGKSNPDEAETGTVLPEPACSRVECGEKPLFYQRCPDGTGVGASSTCERSSNGQCSYIMEPCPTPAAAGSGSGAVTGSGRGSGTAEPLGCLPEQCGPQKPMMEAICPDGRSTTRPTGRCVAIADACGWEMSSCP